MTVPSLTIQHFPKTQEGQSLVATQKVFCLGGKLYQGWQQTIIDVKERQLSDLELEAVYDVDESIGMVKAQRRARNESRMLRKEQELSERRAVARAKERDELELLKLKRDLDIQDPVAPEESALNPTFVSTVDPDPALAITRDDTVIADSTPTLANPTETQLQFKCDACGSMPGADHKNPKAWLRMHTVGKHNNPKQ